jgi:hypothetical protein
VASSKDDEFKPKPIPAELSYAIQHWHVMDIMAVWCWWLMYKPSLLEDE